jgi:hypothetical protein
MTGDGLGAPPRKPAHGLEDLYEDAEQMSPDERAKLDQELEQSFVDEEAERLIDADDALADPKSSR